MKTERNKKIVLPLAVVEQEILSGRKGDIHSKMQKILKLREERQNLVHKHEIDEICEEGNK